MKTKKITQVQIKSFLKGKLSSDPIWARHGLVKIFEAQTEDEQNCETVIERNGVGFTGSDGEFMSSLAKQFIAKKYLSDKQMTYVFKAMPKYWGQIYRISDQEKLNLLITANS